ncbi:hypothetical protein L1049_008595 [Liquidambar formosana]|uniref:Senescence regulator S40 n=1 Tax=Liquidambar formosana TaxID=63359 RepID=A0AAP0X994_LIQFO
MEPNGVLNFRHRRSPSSDRFLDVFSQPETTAGEGDVDELNEDEVFWTGDFTEPNRRSNSTSSAGDQNHHRLGFGLPEKFGILAALSEDEQKRNLRNSPVLYRKPSISSSPSRIIPAIPKPPHNTQEREFLQFSQSMPTRKFHQSAPMNVPVLPKAMAIAKANAKNRDFIEVDDDDDGEDEMLPPHEIVARGSAVSPKTTFSVLEGVGRTLKGRDLRQVRNAVWRQTGFLD